MICKKPSIIQSAPFACMILLPLLSFSQAVSRQSINLAIDKYCACVFVAHDKSDILACELDIDTTSAKLSELDKFYTLRKIIKQCGEAEKRFHENPPDLKTVDDFFAKGCTHLEEKDLEKFKLKRVPPPSLFSALLMMQTWESDTKENGQVLQLVQHTQTVEELEKFKKQNNDTTDTGKIIQHPYFDLIRIANEAANGSYTYAIVAREARLICHLKIVLRKQDDAIAGELIELLANRLRACEL